ncbi:hypothetical protein IT414_01795 [bacterium]|nr:hypothetical protein [bacterium]
MRFVPEKVSGTHPTREAAMPSYHITHPENLTLEDLIWRASDDARYTRDYLVGLTLVKTSGLYTIYEAHHEDHILRDAGYEIEAEWFTDHLTFIVDPDGKVIKVYHRLVD